MASVVHKSSTRAHAHTHTHRHTGWLWRPRTLASASRIVTATMTRGLIKTHSPFIRAVERKGRRARLAGTRRRSHPPRRRGRCLTDVALKWQERGLRAGEPSSLTRGSEMHFTYRTPSACLLTGTAIYNLKNLSSTLWNRKGAQRKHTSSGSPRKTFA